MDFRRDGDPLDTYLHGDYQNASQEERFLLDGERGLTNSLKYISSALKTYGLPAIGNLFSPDLSEVKKTADCLYSLLQQRQKDLSFRTDIYEKVSRVNSEKEDLDRKLTASNEVIEALKREVAGLKQQIAVGAGRLKQERDKLLSERDEIKRDFDKILLKEKHYLNSINQNEKKALALQEKLQKLQGEKDIQLKNHLEIVRPLHTDGPALFSKSGDTEFSYLVTKGFEESQNRLLNENLELRNALEILQKELQDMMRQRREAFHLRLKSEAGEDAELPILPDLTPIRPEFFSLPTQTLGEDVLRTFQDNIQRFRRFLDEVETRQGEFDPSWELLKEGSEGEAGKVRSLSQLNEVLRQYRMLVQNQENLIQRVTLGSKTRPPEQVNYTASRLQLTSDREYVLSQDPTSEQVPARRVREDGAETEGIGRGETDRECEDQATG